MPRIRKRLAILEVTSDVEKRMNTAAHNFSHHNYLNLEKVARKDFEVLLIPVLERDPQEVLAVIEHADALVIGGGEDIDPSFYNGEEEYRRRAQVFDRADQIQIDAIRVAVDAGIPILGICRGMQLLNVVAGGGIVQDLGEDNTHVNPKMFEENHMAKTVIDLEPSQIRDALGKSRIRVHCNHHQSIKDIPQRFSIVGTSGEVVEAIEDDYNRLYGVQWHPEDRHTSARPLRRLLRLLDQ
jgi:putative glutamine amidotransferase